MNPELPQVRSNAETMPQIPGGIEYHPDGTVRSPERITSAEKAPVAPAETLAQPSSVALPPVMIPPPSQVVQQPVVSLSTDDVPLVAADEDLIEKEWVDKLKKIISLTKDDPYERSRVIAQLQADYLKKRYNRSLGQADGQ